MVTASDSDGQGTSNSSGILGAFTALEQMTTEPTAISDGFMALRSRNLSNNRLPLNLCLLDLTMRARRKSFGRNGTLHGDSK